MKISQYEIEQAYDQYNFDLPYHNFKHAVEVMRKVGNVFPESSEEYNVLCRAALWHDAGYIPGAKDNEERAAQLLLSFAPNEMVAADLIRKTTIEHHLSSDPTNDQLLDILLDADILSFALPYEEFVWRQVCILREHRQTDIALSSKFLSNFLKKPQIFRFFIELEDVSRYNIARLLYEFPYKRHDCF